MSTKTAVERLVRVRTRLPLFWQRTIKLGIRAGGETVVVDLALVIASPGEWGRLISCDSSGWWESRFGPFVVGAKVVR
jgi:selenophosphate synthetase-related protein